MASFKVPDLRVKLQKLYRSGRNPSIARDDQLAAKLLNKEGKPITTSQIENWCLGTAGMTPNAIPGKHVERVCQLFNIERGDLQLTDLRRFEERLARPLSGWARLFQRAESHNPLGKLAIIPHRSERPILSEYRADSRGVGKYNEAEDQDVEGECLQLKEEFHINIEGPSAWYVTVLVQDPLGVECLNRYFPPLRFGEALPTSLPPEDRRPFFADQPTGAHWIVAAISQNPLPESLHGQLTDPLITNREKALDELDRWLENTSADQCFVLHQSFFIANPSKE